MKLKHFLLLLIIGLIVIDCSDEKYPENGYKLWPEIDAYETGHLKVSELHEIYYELSGKRDGIPVFAIHGGPGVGSSPYMRRFFDPEKYLIVLHDQRGCGKSTPNSELKENTTQDLVEDIEKLRQKLKLGKIILFGGSWGSTLSLSYAETYPENVSAMVLRGIFLGTQEEDDILYQNLADFFPEEEQACIDYIQDSTGNLTNQSIFDAYLSEEKSKQSMKLVSHLFAKASTIYTPDSIITNYIEAKENFNEISTTSMIAHHYYVNNCFLTDQQLLNNVERLSGIPVIIINGRYDILCPPVNAYRLYKALPGSKLVIAEESGHLMSEPAIEKELVKAMMEMEIKN